MLNKKFRLKKNYQFSYVYKKGNAIPSKHLVLIYAKARGSVKVGFSVSNKTGKAVVRNKTKRRLRSIVSELFPSLCVGYNYVFAARNTIAECDFCELKAIVARLIERAAASIQNKAENRK